MKNFLRSGFSNPLAPFIMIFALIIMTTIIVSNIKNSTDNNRQGELAAKQNLIFDPTLSSNLSQNEANKSAPDTPDLQLLATEALLDWAKADFNAAEDKFRTILVFTPNSPVALSHLGALLYHRGDYKNAELMFRRQTLFFPSDPNAYMNLGTVLAKQNKLNEAIKVSKRSLELDPSSSATALSLAKIYALANSKEIAMDYFKRAASSMGAQIVEASWDPAFDSIRKLPEFETIVKKAGAHQ